MTQRRTMSRGLISVHVGLMGHIDHGKTALARAISEKVSTAGLDKHPQSQQRGITIDLGFTMFVLDRYMVTLVDAPGHADLIRSVVAGANIIDTAILTVAADEGPKVQTGEHIIVLESMGIDSLIVAITKTDLVDDAHLDRVEEQVRSVLSGTGFRRVEYVRVSSKDGVGIDDLRESLLRVILPRKRDTKGPLLLPIDHAFLVKGHGTVVTGTVLRGSLRIGDLVEIAPLDMSARVRSIQTFGESRQTASAGDRVGINVPEVDSAQVSRGDYLCEPGSIRKSDKLFVRIERNPLYRGRMSQRMLVSVSVGMATTTAELIPFAMENGRRVALDNTDSSFLDVALLLNSPVPVYEGARALLMRTDLPPTQMRIMGHGTVVDAPTTVTMWRRKTREGVVQRIREDDVLVAGLAPRRALADRLKGTSVWTENGVEGVIREAFGTRGVVAVTFNVPVSPGDKVLLDQLKEEAYRFGTR
ncbi:MAG: selenocysteine-specific translation elongation factor [Candidatus Thorarchaeota archaeon]|nr:MAG: selenocysteine-specific translation elongation factor [Candidatus Thorarchaeota archaeon]